MVPVCFSMCSTRSSSKNTVDPDEVRRFQSLAGKWWDEKGEFAALHAMNDLRVPFIRCVSVQNICFNIYHTFANAEMSGPSCCQHRRRAVVSKSNLKQIQPCGVGEQRSTSGIRRSNRNVK